MDTIFSFHDLARVLLLSLPLVVGGILHMAAVKGDILSYFKKPIHHRWFGQNKTWRGFVIMPMATWPGVLLAQQMEPVFDLNAPLISHLPSVTLSLALGMGYCLAELPNSYMKRKMGIKEGQTADKNKWIFILADQGDSAVGCMLAYLFFIDLELKIFFAAIVGGTAIHLIFNILLYLLKLRKNPF